MNICTWNMRHNNRAWEWLLNTSGPDIALLQESVPPRTVPSNYDFIWKSIGGNYNWGSGILVKNLPAKAINLKTYAGWVTAAEITIKSNFNLIAISLHAQIVDGYSITTLHHIFSDLTYLIDGAENVLLGGDFNAGLLWDKKQNSTTHKILFDRVEAFGLKNCHRLHHDNEQRTFRNKTGENWQLDHMFISNHLSGKVRSCVVVQETDEIVSLSDHNPIVMVAEF